MLIPLNDLDYERASAPKFRRSLGMAGAAAWSDFYSKTGNALVQRDDGVERHTKVFLLSCH